MAEENKEKTDNKLPAVSPTPHVRDKSSTGKIMGCVILGLLPATAVGVWNFGPKALFIVISCKYYML